MQVRNRYLGRTIKDPQRYAFIFALEFASEVVSISLGTEFCKEKSVDFVLCN